VTATRFDRILALAKALVADERKSLALADARGRLSPGSTRARVTSANANWANAAERRDRSIDALTAECAAVLGLVPR
jgi:hypothetical protein